MACALRRLQNARGHPRGQLALPASTRASHTSIPRVRTGEIVIVVRTVRSRAGDDSKLSHGKRCTAECGPQSDRRCCVGLVLRQVPVAERSGGLLGGTINKHSLQNWCRAHRRPQQADRSQNYCSPGAWLVAEGLVLGVALRMGCDSDSRGLRSSFQAEGLGMSGL